MLFIMGAGLSRNITTLLVLRFLAGAASSGPLTNGAGSIADMFPAQLRGFATGIWLIGPFLGPALGQHYMSYFSHALTSPRPNNDKLRRPPPNLAVDPMGAPDPLRRLLANLPLSTRDLQKDHPQTPRRPARPASTSRPHSQRLGQDPLPHQRHYRPRHPHAPH
jgi:hypothetical protein